MQPKFVTAIYTHLNGTLFNGSPHAIYERYKQSLRSLAKGGYEIVCYAPDHHGMELIEFFAEFPNVEIILEELTTFPRHDLIERLKIENTQYLSDASWVTRCVEIMWGKFHWLKRHAMTASDDQPVFWIDAGIFHSGLMHDKWKSPKSDNEFDFDRITQERDLYADLVRFSKGNVLNCRSLQPNHGCDDYLEVFGHQDGRPQYGIIAGIFGGVPSKLIPYLDLCIAFTDETLNAGKLLKEEEIMHRVHFLDDSNITTFFFETWYHEDWPDEYRRGGRISFSDYFETLRH